MSAVDLRAWTTPRRLALEVFFLNHGKARRSNTSDVENATAYWQCVDWLVDNDLVRKVDIDMYRLTALGWSDAQLLWNVPQETFKRMLSQALGR